MTQNENAPTILWVKYMFNGEMKEINSAEADIEGIFFSGPGMYEIHREQGIIDFIVSSETEHKAKRDQSNVHKLNLAVPS